MTPRPRAPSASVRYPALIRGSRNLIARWRLRLLAEVDAWLASDVTDWPFAFVTICHTLNIDPDYIRRGLRRSRTRLEATTQRKPPLRRDANGTRHQVVLYVTAPRRIA